MSEMILKYKNGDMPENLSEILANADEQDLRILIALMMVADGEGKIDGDFSLTDHLGLERPEIDASIKYWKGAGVIGLARATKKNKTVAPGLQKTAVSTAHRDGAVEKSTGVAHYNSAELADLLESRSELSSFLEEIDRVVGRILNNSEKGIVVGLVEQYGFELEALIHIFDYSVKSGKKGIRTLEKIALDNFYDEGLISTDKVIERITLMEASKETVYRIRQLAGWGDRELTTKEKNTFKRWTVDFNYGIDVIRMAYEITVDRKNDFKLSYMNAIIEKWNAEGLRTVADVEAREQTKKQEKQIESGKSYDLDDFFEAALQRSLDDLK